MENISYTDASELPEMGRIQNKCFKNMLYFKEEKYVTIHYPVTQTLLEAHGKYLSESDLLNSVQHYNAVELRTTIPLVIYTKLYLSY